MTEPLSLPRQRLHPLTPLVRGAKLVALAAVAVSWRGLSDLGLERWLLSMAAILVAAVLVSAVVWAVTGYEVVGRELRVHEGLLSRRVRTIPLERVQAIDIVRPAVARVFGLAELRLEVIGGGKAEAPLAYLTVAGATELRASLLGVATGAAPGGPAAERPLFAVDNSRLLAAQLLTPQLAAVPVGLAFVVWPATVHPDWTLIGAASTITAFLGVFQVPVRRVLDEWDFHIADDAAALRLRQGLLNKRSQSVPPRRVQGVKLTWPLLWRAAGWARARMDVAGYGRDGEEQLRAGTLVPVDTAARTAQVAATVLGAAVDPRPAPPPIDAAALPVTGPPARARWLAPFAWNRIGVAVTDDVVAVREGVLTRELMAVPLARVQSVRVTQGPFERLLSLATVTVDTAGGMRASARLRDAADAYHLADVLAARSRTARRTFSARLPRRPAPTAPLAPPALPEPALPEPALPEPALPEPAAAPPDQPA
ncbi:PH domain-containing protein [Dactylosporangium sp. CA-092794]|uniref:PH domain-containing protein n=1 Tax=Dactylosporangium sp. CA-092794 TaxID=3239929 RepID=UPI003D8B475E